MAVHVSKTTLQQAVDALAKYGSKEQAALHLGWSVSTVKSRIKQAIIAGLTPDATLTKGDDKKELLRLQTEIKVLMSRLKKSESERWTEERIKSEVLKLVDSEPTIPDWLSVPKHIVDDLTGVPTFFASDWHFAEVINAAEIGGVNEYNMAIAKTRARTFIQVGIDLLKNHMKSPKYEGCVFILGGDMVSGDIHEELQQTNEVESLPAVVELFGVLSWCVSTLADEFGKVFIPCVTGNHGRMSRKPRAKRRNHTNFDWLLYQMLRLKFEDDKRVTFLIPEGPDVLFSVYDTRYLLTHGDQFRGGDGMAGAVVPIARGDKRKRAKQMQVDMGYDILLMGHWHQYMHLGRWIVNGSLKGYDEYADSMNLDYEPPQQAVWVTHPHHGVTFRMPVFVDRKAKKAKLPWISWEKPLP